MGEEQAQPRPAIEVVDIDNRRAEMRAVLRHFLERVEAGEDFTGCMVIMEKPRGAYVLRDVKMTSTDNVAERLGRLDLLHDDVLNAADEERERQYDNPPRRKRA